MKPLQDRYYFLGIGGIGMSALARYCFLRGAAVAGYDANPSKITKELAALGIQVSYIDHPLEVPLAFRNPVCTKLIYTPAVPRNTVLFQYFKNSGFDRIKRAVLLGDCTADSFTYAVAGTHGKTTVSCLLAYLLDASGVKITAFLGGISNNFKSNLLVKDTAVTVVEADEFDRSFLNLSPQVACITATDADHLDIYKTPEALENSFKDFAKKATANGVLFVHESVRIPGITYGVHSSCDYYVSGVSIQDGHTYANLHTPTECFNKVYFPMPGMHNVLNALVAFAMAYMQGVPVQALIGALASFKGVARRFSFEIKNKKLVFVDDYAHHPTAIKAVYNSLKALYPNKAMTVVFQPHLYSRTQDFMGAFARVLSLFEQVILLEIYPARELPIVGVSSQVLLEQITSPKKALVTKEGLIKTLRQASPEVLVTLGAGDIGLEVPKVKAIFL